MSTVSTFVIDIFYLCQSTKQWHAYAYAALLFCYGTLDLLSPHLDKALWTPSIISTSDFPF